MTDTIQQERQYVGNRDELRAWFREFVTKPASSPAVGDAPGEAPLARLRALMHASPPRTGRDGAVPPTTAPSAAYCRECGHDRDDHLPEEYVECFETVQDYIRSRRANPPGCRECSCRETCFEPEPQDALGEYDFISPFEIQRLEREDREAWAEANEQARREEDLDEWLAEQEAMESYR